MYFNSLIIIANMILLNLFLAILLSEFDKPLEDSAGKDAEASSFAKFRKRTQVALKSCLKRFEGYFGQRINLSKHIKTSSSSSEE